MKTFEYPCTGNIGIEGFGAYLEQEVCEPRRNINLFAKELKEQFCKNSDAHISLVNSGSSANLVAALALAEKVRKVGKPMTAIMSGFTFPTTVSALLMAGFEVRLIDVEEGGFNMKFTDLWEPSVICITHFLGFAADIRRWREFANRRGAFILQDACETLDLRIAPDRWPALAFGDITTWSFYHPHHLSSYGGGAVITLSQEDYALVDSIAHWGRACKCHIYETLCHVPVGPAHQFTYERLGVNVEMSELNACFGRWQLRNWEQIETIRKRNYRLLYNALSKEPCLKVWPMPDDTGSPFVFPIYLNCNADINDIYKPLYDLGVEIRTLMGGATCEQAAYKGKLQFGDDQANAKHMAQKTFFVGIHNTLSEEAVASVAQHICTWAKAQYELEHPQKEEKNGFLHRMVRKFRDFMERLTGEAEDF